MLILTLSLLYVLMVYFILRIFKLAAKDDDISFGYQQEHHLIN